MASLPEAFRVLTDPAETGAVTISLPEDVQAEAHDWPIEFFEKRIWHVRRPVPEPELVREVVKMLKAAKRPLITVIVVPVDPEKRMPGIGTWWDVPVADVSGEERTRQTRETYEKATENQRPVFA